MPRVRIYRSSDYYYIDAIEQEGFNQPWTSEELKTILDYPCNMVYVAEHGNIVVGYMCYTWTKNYYNIFNIAVAKNYRLQGYGKELVGKLIERLGPPLFTTDGVTSGLVHGRNRIVITVRESNLDAQLFLKKVGFRYFADDNDYFDGEKGYVFKYSLAFR
jgi:ribosomal-protein-alanine N-acetyltransferase